MFIYYESCLNEITFSDNLSSSSGHSVLQLRFLWIFCKIFMILWIRKKWQIRKFRNTWLTLFCLEIRNEIVVPIKKKGSELRTVNLAWNDSCICIHSSLVRLVLVVRLTRRTTQSYYVPCEISQRFQISNRQLYNGLMVSIAASVSCYFLSFFYAAITFSITRFCSYRHFKRLFRFDLWRMKNKCVKIEEKNEHGLQKLTI